ncbi:DUF2125 domain-containing protein [uncultured Sulfitobacter sp.]|uniref:DUF2125 domain-containing protein n=1 Tax=uncultured Sulfitobacter sp. TaxID=191468 RepID=UPI002621CF4D|nr:DUF2125 domain-containing protein [uncultured Sulfitobacter sp.]
MSIARAYLTSTAISLSLFATAASADLTAANVWEDWRGYMEGMGYVVTATEDVSGDKLSVSDIAVQIEGGPDISSMTMRMGMLEFVELGDGTVEVVMPAVMPMTIDIVPKSTPRPARISLDYTQDGQRMIASGDAAAMQYDYTADSFGIALSGLSVDGTEFDETTARFALTGTGVESKTNVSVGETRRYTQSLKIGQAAHDLFFKSPDGVEAMTLNNTMQNLSLESISALPVSEIPQTQDIMPLIAAGFAVDGTFKATGSETKIEVVSEEGTSKIKTGSASSTLGIAMGADGIIYDVAATEVQLGAQLAGLPFPLFAEMAQSGFEMRAPVMKSETPQDFSLAFDMTDFTMSDIIWALFDPSGQLPRDPATIALGLRGKAKVLFDTLDPEQMGKLAGSGAVPGELNALTIDRLTVDAVGARVDATGDFTFDNTDTTTLPGFPKPVGDINIDVAGANALMDKLVAMGLLPADQVMGARMMLGLFAVPGDADDTLKSKIEFNEAGQILANGQRIK